MSLVIEHSAQLKNGEEGGKRKITGQHFTTKV